MPRADSTVPSGSRPTCSADRLVGTTASTTAKVTTETAAVAKKIDCHENWPSIQPEASIPSVPPAPANPAQMPTARARSSGGNTLVMVDRVPGMISAPPRPVSARKAMSCVPESANADKSEPAPNSAMPTSSAPRRP